MENEQQVASVLKGIETKVPHTVRERIDDTLASLPQKKRRSKWLLLGTTAASLMFIVIALGSLSPAFANTLKSIPVVGSVFDMFGDDGLKNQVTESEIGQTASSKTSTLTITDVIYDGARLSIGYIQTFTGDVDQHNIFDGLDFKVNGKRLDYYGMSATGQALDDHQYAGILTIDGAPDKDAFTFTMLLTQLGEDKGNWKIKIPVKKTAGGETYLINQPANYEDAQLMFEHINFNPATIEIQYRSKEPIAAAEERWDDEAESSTELSYRLFDEKGVEFAPIGSIEKGDVFVEEGQLQFVPSGKQHEYVTLQLVEIHVGEEESVKQHKMLSEQSTPFTLSQGEAGEITIESIEHSEGKTTVQYTVNGYDEYHQANALWFQDSHGKQYDSTRIRPERVSDQEMRYEMVFEDLSHLDDLSIWTYEIERPKVIDELTIPLEKE